MRWPWDPPPGKKRISRRRYIELLQGALRARELEAEIAGLRAAQTLRELDLLRGYGPACGGCQPHPAAVAPLAAALAAALDGRHTDAHELVAEAVQGPHHRQVAALVRLASAVVPPAVAPAAADQVRAVLLAAAEAES